MKKILLAVSLLATLFFVGCSDDIYQTSNIIVETDDDNDYSDFALVGAVEGRYQFDVNYSTVKLNVSLPEDTKSIKSAIVETGYASKADSNWSISDVAIDDDGGYITFSLSDISPADQVMIAIYAIDGDGLTIEKNYTLEAAGTIGLFEGEVNIYNLRDDIADLDLRDATLVDDEGEVLTGLPDEVFSGNTTLEKVMLSESITSIGASAFADCTSLEYLFVGNIESVGTDAFSGYTELVSILCTAESNDALSTYFSGTGVTVVFDASDVLTLGDYEDYATYESLLTANPFLTSVVSAEESTVCADYLIDAVIGYENITSLDFSAATLINNLSTEITEFPNTFAKYSATTTYITSIKLPKNVTSIAEQAFNTCRSLEYIDLSNVTEIKSQAFINCYGLKSLGDLSNLETIGGSAFVYCSSLEELDLSNVTSMGEGVFSGCSSLTTADISGLTEVPASSFTMLSNLTSVTLGSGVTTIGTNAFFKCTSLSSINLESVETIDQYAFYQCLLLTSVDISNVTSLGTYAFWNCKLLESVVLSDQLTTIEDLTFAYCYPLVNIDLSNLETIGSQAFNTCRSMETIDLSSATSVNATAFLNCSALATVYCSASNQSYISTLFSDPISVVEK